MSLGDSTPATAGVVEEVTPHAVAILTDVPMRGIYEIGVWPFERPTVVVRAYLYGDDGRDVVERVGPEWAAWLRANVEGFTPMG